MDGRWALFRRESRYNHVEVDCRQIAKVTPRIVRFVDSRYPRQANTLNIVAVISDEAEALRLRDSIAGVSGEFMKRKRSAEDERAARITAARIAADASIQRLLAEAGAASGIAAATAGETGTGSTEGKSPTGEAGDAHTQSPKVSP